MLVVGFFKGQHGFCDGVAARLRGSLGHDADHGFDRAAAAEGRAHGWRLVVVWRRVDKCAGG